VHDRIEQGVMGRAGTPIGPTLHRLWRTAERDMERFRDGLERWLDGEMSRLGGLYKRTVRWILAIIALVVAVVLNIDTVGLAGDLWENPAGRSALVAQAEGLAVSDQGDPSAGAGDTALLRLRQACESAAGEEGQGEGTAVDQAAAAVADVRACLNDAFDDLNQLDITGDSLTNGWQGWQQTWTGDAFSQGVVPARGRSAGPLGRAGGRVAVLVRRHQTAHRHPGRQGRRHLRGYPKRSVTTSSQSWVVRRSDSTSTRSSLPWKRRAKSPASRSGLKRPAP
jgi:hypothetical protein